MQDAGIADKVIAALRELAGAAGHAVEKLWPMAVQATWADGIGCLVAGTFIVIGLLALLRMMWKTPIKPDSDLEMARYFISVISGLVLLVTVVITINSGLPKVLAPEGLTIYRILGR